MRQSERMASLVGLQRLAEQARLVDLASSQAQLAIEKTRLEELSQSRETALRALAGVMDAATFCPDRMLMASGQLSRIEETRDQCRNDLAIATSREEHSRQQWHESCQRTKVLEDRRRSSKRTEDRRAEFRTQSEQLSLGAALGRRIGE